MKNDFSTPFSLHFLMHNEYKDNLELRKYLYKTFCRNSEDVNFDGLDIPVYFHIGSERCKNYPKIEEVKNLNIIIPLIDELMFCDLELGKYLDQLVDNDKYSIIPVILSRNALDMNEKLSKKQFISLSSYSILENKIEFEIIMFEILNRLLSSTPQNKLKLFISHSKRDKDKIGLSIAEKLVKYIHTETKLSSFFDTKDILDGQNFEETIKNNIKDSLFILINSDTYSDREWCRKEVLECKTLGVPAIRIEALQNQCSRIFPYMANIPSIRYNENFNEIVHLMLRTALDWRYQQSYLKTLSNFLEKKESIIEPTIPELLSIHCHHKNDDIVLYPEPPVGIEELNILNQSFENKKFLTPMQILTKDINLNNKKIAISLSEPIESENNIIGPEGLNDLAIELARHLLAAKAQLVYGGDLRYNGFTKQLAQLSYKYYKDQHCQNEDFSFHNFFFWPIYNKITQDDIIFLKKNRVQIHKALYPLGILPSEKSLYIEPDNKHNKFLWSQSLTIMRKERSKFADAVIALGGRTRGFNGSLPGIIEEILIALYLNKPIYLLGSAGGATKILVDCILGNITPLEAVTLYEIDRELKNLLEEQNFTKKEKNFFDMLSRKGLKCLNNGLTPQQNMKLMRSNNLTEIVALILFGLKEVFHNA